MAASDDTVRVLQPDLLVAASGKSALACLFPSNEGASHLGSKAPVKISQGWQGHEALVCQLLGAVTKYKGSIDC